MIWRKQLTTMVVYVPFIINGIWCPLGDCFIWANLSGVGWNRIPVSGI